MFALILFTLPKQPLNVTGVNLTVIYPTKIPPSTSLWLGICRGSAGCLGVYGVYAGCTKGVWLCSGYVEQVEG